MPILPSALQRVLVITGAGVSAESGIPTFRGKEGYWREKDPVALATKGAFIQDPDLIWEWYAMRRSLLLSKQPNPGHMALAELARISKDFLLITQNVDEFHEMAGTKTEQLVHIHGNIFIDRCINSDFETINRTAEIPHACPRCGSRLRPGVVWFDEELARTDTERIEDFFARGPISLALVVGTTASFDYIWEWTLRAKRSGARLIEVNPEPSQLSGEADEVLREKAGSALSRLLLERVS